MPLAQQSDNRRQEVEDKSTSKERKKEEPKDVHSDLLQE
jgi:hypothetical protein